MLSYVLAAQGDCLLYDYFCIFKNRFIFICICHVSMGHLCMGTQRGQKKLSDPRELELQAEVRTLAAALHLCPLLLFFNSESSLWLILSVVADSIVLSGVYWGLRIDHESNGKKMTFRPYYNLVAFEHCSHTIGRIRNQKVKARCTKSQCKHQRDAKFQDNTMPPKITSQPHSNGLPKRMT